MKRKKLVTVLILAALVVMSGLGGTAEANKIHKMPWDSFLQDIADSLTGPVAFSLGLLMIVCGFCATAFVGSELGGWVRWIAMATILAGMLGAAPSLLPLIGLKSAIIG
jgi:type IV secretory pathway VirB2 component (pilin)